MLNNNQHQLAAEAIKNAKALLITAGAGMGCDSGLPDFRGDEGFWKAYPLYERLGMSFADLAIPSLFDSNPRLAWGFYGHRLNLYRKSVPHDGYHILKKWADSMPNGYFAFTSNVDGAFKKTGFDPKKILECHGSIHLAQCSEDCGYPIFSAAPFNVQVDESTMKAIGKLPDCPKCHAVARPNIKMFGDFQFKETLLARREEDYVVWVKNVLREEDHNLVVVELGAGTAIPTIRWLGEGLQGLYGATLVRINPREPHGGTVCIPETALSALSQIDALL